MIWPDGVSFHVKHPTRYRAESPGHAGRRSPGGGFRDTRTHPASLPTPGRPTAYRQIMVNSAPAVTDALTVLADAGLDPEIIATIHGQLPPAPLPGQEALPLIG